MSVHLIVTGADSAAVGVPDKSIPQGVFETFEEARLSAVEFSEGWEKLGYHRTPAGIWVRGSEWRRVVVVDEFGVNWHLP